MRRRLSGLWMVINPKFRNLKSSSSSCSSSVHWDRKETDGTNLFC